MTPIQEVLREMREKADEPQGYGEQPITGDDVHRWADAVGQAMREPVAEVNEDQALQWCPPSSVIRTPGTKLSALPPIDTRDESCRESADTSTTQEPVAWFIQNQRGHEFTFEKPDASVRNVQPLYALPPEAAAKIERLRERNLSLQQDRTRLLEEIERLKEENTRLRSLVEFEPDLEAALKEGAP